MILKILSIALLFSTSLRAGINDTDVCSEVDRGDSATLGGYAGEIPEALMKQIESFKGEVDCVEKAREAAGSINWVKEMNKGSVERNIAGGLVLQVKADCPLGDCSDSSMKVCTKGDVFEERLGTLDHYCRQLERRFRVDQCKENVNNNELYNSTPPAFLKKRMETASLIGEAYNDYKLNYRKAFEEISKLKPSAIHAIANAEKSNLKINEVLTSLKKENNDSQELDFNGEKPSKLGVESFREFNKFSNPAGNLAQINSDVDEYIKSNPFEDITSSFKSLDDFISTNSKSVKSIREEIDQKIVLRKKISGKEFKENLQAFIDKKSDDPKSINYPRVEFFDIVNSILNSTTDDELIIIKEGNTPLNETLVERVFKDPSLKRKYDLASTRSVETASDSNKNTNIDVKKRIIIQKLIAERKIRKDKKTGVYSVKPFDDMRKNIADNYIKTLKDCVLSKGSLTGSIDPDLVTSNIVNEDYLSDSDVQIKTSQKFTVDGSLSSDEALYHNVFSDYSNMDSYNKVKNVKLSCSDMESKNHPNDLVPLFGFGNPEKQREFYKNDCEISQGAELVSGVNKSSLARELRPGKKLFEDAQLHVNEAQNQSIVDSFLQNPKNFTYGMKLNVSGGASDVSMSADHSDMYKKEYGLDAKIPNEFKNEYLALSRGIYQINDIRKKLKESLSNGASTVQKENGKDFLNKLKISKVDFVKSTSAMGEGFREEARKMWSSIPDELKTESSNDSLAFDFKVEKAKVDGEELPWISMGSSRDDMSKYLSKVIPGDSDNIKGMSLGELQYLKKRWMAGDVLGPGKVHTYDDLYRGLRKEELLADIPNSKKLKVERSLRNFIKMKSKVVLDCLDESIALACEGKYEESTVRGVQAVSN